MVKYSISQNFFSMKFCRNLLRIAISDGRGQKVPAWLFSTLSFGVGEFAILPYLGLRQPNSIFSGKKNLFLNILNSLILGIALGLGTIFLLIYSLKSGEWADFIRQWQSSRFIHVMSLDFCMLCLLFLTILEDDMSRQRKHKTSSELFF